MIDHLRERGLGVDPVCRVLELSPSTYFARKKRPKSARRLRDEQLMPLIEEVHADSGGTYGVRRITRALGRRGVEVARCTVERLMAELGLEGVIRGRVLDVYSRMIVGWQVANHMRTELPLDALEMALWRRRIKKDS
ncbi:IS3 family transposase, partial [Streptomyces sp. B27]|uniref:IS3 family transposase n=1 Tax=Streptomyces sp. B27 TaxID=2485015 RepID=UPI0013E374AE